MKKTRLALMLIAAVLFALPNLVAQTVKMDDILGTWLNEEGDAHIEIMKKDTKFFGKVSWIKDPIDPETGKEKTDTKNPDESLRSRPRLGLEILTNFVYDGDDRWEDGKIYDPKSGKTYSCYIQYIDKNKLKIRGYIGVSLIGKTTYWTRVE